MEHLKLFATRVNVPKLIRVCDELRQRPWRWLGDGGQRKAKGEREARSGVSRGGSDPGSPPPSWPGC